MRYLSVITALAVCAALMAPAVAQDAGTPKKETTDKKAPAAKAPEAKPAAKAAAASGQDDMAKMMAAYAAAAMPGKQHENLKQLAGNWKISGKWRMSADAPWDEHTSHSKAEMMFNGLFLKSSVKGDQPMPDMPMTFEGVGIMGFDKSSNKYTSMWIDNMGCGMMYSEGDGDAQGKTLSFKGSYKDPVSGADTWARSVLKIETPDKYTFEMYGPGTDGKEFQNMVLVYERVKG